MECNKDEAIRAKEIAEKKMKNNDFEGARKIALKAQKLFPGLDNISQLLAVCDVHCSAQKKINGSVVDFYGILKLESFADDATIKKQYRKLALVLHPDKNQFPGAEAAFKLIGEANMILSDKAKRYFHDTKCREPVKPSVPKPQNHQGNQNSYAGMQFGANPKFSNVSNGKPSFWTACPFCKIKYELYRDVVNKRITCRNCSQLFTAIDLGPYQSAQPNPSVHPGMHKVEPESNTGRHASFQQEEVGKVKKAKVEPPKAEPSFTPFSHQGPQSTQTGDAKFGGSVRPETVENCNLKAKSGKEGVTATKDSGGNPIDVSDSDDGHVQKRSRKRVQVSSREDKLDEFIPEKRSRLRKLSSDVKENQKKQREVLEAEFKNDNGKQKEPKASVNGQGCMQKDKIKESDKLKEENGHARSNSDSEEDMDPVFHSVPDLEFSNFDESKEPHCFAVDQIWAVYDQIDSMPRFYAQVKKVYASGFRLRISWLEADPENHLEKTWAKEGLPIACGRFKRGASEDTSDRLMFSHQISFEKGIKKFSFVIYPRKGEIWALFKDWDIKWSSDPESHKEYKFEIVEVLSDFDNDNGILVSYMVKVEGFVSLFQKTSRARLAEFRIPCNELLRFSHRIPSKKLTGNERENVPIGSYELDNTALPDDLDQFYFSNNVKVKPEHVSNHSGASCPKSPEVKANNFVRGKINVRKSPRGLKCNSEQSNGIDSKSNIATSSKGIESFCHDDDMNTNLNGKESDIVAHDFDEDKENWKFEKGQIWALRSMNGKLGCYAFIKNIEKSPLRLHVNLLEICSNSIRPNACGLYKICNGAVQILQRESFLYLVKAELNGKTKYNIYPRENEIWVLHDTLDAKCTFPNAGDCEIVEVVDNNVDVVKVSSLSRVPGQKSIYRYLGKVMEIPLAESDRFFCRVPAFRLTDELDGCMRGNWVLNLAEFPGLYAS
uniref:uncharacterized protein LOC122609739 n=1 Tax=Erigeron canadensis TaxID=72917 RepID=UPI001CB92E9F|nr:uncharacterized protein LOC122609739 [Erigeron canadensis]